MGHSQLLRESSETHLTQAVVVVFQNVPDRLLFGGGKEAAGRDGHPDFHFKNELKDYENKRHL